MCAKHDGLMRWLHDLLRLKVIIFLKVWLNLCRANVHVVVVAWEWTANMFNIRYLIKIFGILLLKMDQTLLAIFYYLEVWFSSQIIFIICNQLWVALLLARTYLIRLLLTHRIYYWCCASYQINLRFDFKVVSERCGQMIVFLVTSNPRRNWLDFVPGEDLLQNLEEAAILFKKGVGKSLVGRGSFLRVFF